MKTKFHFCPSCRSIHIEIIANHQFICRSCGMEYFHNVASATAVILRHQDQILFTVRNREPHKGMLDLPGGFIDPNETAEEGASRELKEELNLEVDLERLHYLMSQPNTYLYKGIEYKTCDFAFEVLQLNSLQFDLELDEISSVKWVKIDDINLDEIAFDSLRNIVKKYIENQLK
ncbi:NUDIX domain-containing protein [Vaginella massiliensis]|uniref:NUDIX hydrolase n=1 Tax=Vaginella massiliensis TaxID=1816680 RepID=UPI003753C416